jgi:hypothetical protein
LTRQKVRLCCQGAINIDAPSQQTSISCVLSGAKHAAINLALAELKIQPVMRAIQIGHFAVCNARDAQSAGDLLDRSKHLLTSS